jgi:hypothetical protein
MDDILAEQPHRSRDHDYARQKALNDSEVPYYITELPRELRDMIFHHLWTVAPIIAPGASKDERQDRAGYYIAYASISPTSYNIIEQSSLPLWLLISRSFLAEGLKTLQARGTWVLACAWQQFPERWETGLLAFATARNLCLPSLSVGLYYEVNYVVREVIEIFRESNQLRRVEVVFQYDIDPRDQRYEKHPNGDLCLLEMLKVGFPGLVEVVIRVEKERLPKMHFDVWECHDAATYTERVYKDIHRVVAGILGEDVTQCLDGYDEAFGFETRCLTFKKRCLTFKKRCLTFKKK